MLTNDVLRSIRYLLDVGDEMVARIVRLGGGEVSAAEVMSFLEREEAPTYRVMPDRVLGQFLDGLIVHRRGPRAPDERVAPRAPTPPMSNNVVLKKLRVAFELKEDDLIELMRAAGFSVGRPELSALFRNPSHPNYRPCGDQFLRNFLKSLTARVRG
jgi:uncharacterized protein YehS (DUF1456 family)